MNNLLRNLYEDTILDHNHHPRNFKHKPGSINRQAHGYNPLCGDEVTLYLQVENDIIKDIGFDGHGCAISTASASLMTETLKGKPVEFAEHLFNTMHHLLTDEQPADDLSGLGKLKVLQGVRSFPTRIKCATLAWHTLQAALHQKNDEFVTTE